MSCPRTHRTGDTASTWSQFLKMASASFIVWFARQYEANGSRTACGTVFYLNRQGQAGGLSYPFGPGLGCRQGVFGTVDTGFAVDSKLACMEVECAGSGDDGRKRALGFAYRQNEKQA